MLAALFCQGSFQIKPKLNSVLAILLVLGVILISFADADHNVNGEQQSNDRLVTSLSHAVLNWELAKQYRLCLDESRDALIPRSFILSIALSESYARPPWRQQAEFFLARSVLMISGRLPDYSLGVAQIRASTARKIMPELNWIAGRSNDETLLQRLMDQCRNINLADQYISLLAEREGIKTFDRKSADLLLRIYNGQDQEYDAYYNELYRDVVWNTSDVLSSVMP